MTTKTAFITAMGGSLIPMGSKKTFVRSSGNILTATGHGLETGAGPFKIMTAINDAPSGITVAKHARTFVVGNAVIAGDVLVAAGKSYTVTAIPAADGDVDLGANWPITMANFGAAINQDQDAGSTTYHEDTVSNDSIKAGLTADVRLDVVAKTLDAAIGNAITLASPDATLVVDNPTLENGASGTDYFIIRLDNDTFSIATSKVNALAGTAVTLTDDGTGIHKLVSTVQTLADALEDVVTNRLTYKGTRTLPADFNIASFWAAAINGTSNLLD